MILESPTLTPAVYERRRELMIEARAAWYAVLGATGPQGTGKIAGKPCVVEGVRYESAGEASRATGICDSTIKLCCKNGGTAKYWPRGVRHTGANLRVLHARHV
jgi:hypothetical protein